MFLHYRTRGFILKKVDRGETDRIFTIYTKDFGKLELLAKAERKIKSKLRGGLELFYLSEIEFIQGKTYKTLTDTILIDNFKNLRGNLKRLAIAYRISEIFDTLVKGQEPDEKLWQLLAEVFEKLNTLHLRSSTLHLVYHYFLWNLLSILGYQPELYNCSLCQKKVAPEKLYFGLKEGGIICQNCFKSAKQASQIKPEIIKILRLILKQDWPTLSKLKIEAKYLKELSFVSQDYFSSICEENLSSS